MRACPPRPRLLLQSSTGFPGTVAQCDSCQFPPFTDYPVLLIPASHPDTVTRTAALGLEDRWLGPPQRQVLFSTASLVSDRTLPVALSVCSPLGPGLQ